MLLLKTMVNKKINKKNNNEIAAIFTDATDFDNEQTFTPAFELKLLLLSNVHF